MGDRDGTDEQAGEEPDGSQSGDPDDEQPVPSSTATDAKGDTGDEPDVADDERRVPESEEPPDEADDETDSEDAAIDPDGAADLSGRRRSPDEAAASGSGDADEDDADDGDDDRFGAVDADESNWSPPTSDDTFDIDRDPKSEDDPSEWWTDHQTETDDPDEDAGGDEGLDDEELDPAARRNQMQKGTSDTREGIDRSKGPGDHPKSGQPKGASGQSPGSGKHAQAAPNGGGSATARPTGAYGDDPGPTAEPATAPDDEEMPLTEHVEEMALRFLAVALVMFGVAGIIVFYAGDLVNFLWYSFLGDAAVCPGPQCEEAPRVLHPLAVPLAYLKVSTLVGFIVALPVGVYQTYRFMRPGLYPRERRYYLASIPMSLVLAGVGVGFAYFAVLPSMFAYFTNYSKKAAEIAFSLTETFNLMILMLGFFALIFQIPLLVMLAIMMGVTTREWLADRRLYFWAGFAGVAFLFSPDPTGMAPLIVAVTMIALFEGTLTLLRWTGTGSPIPTAEEAADGRPVAYLAAALGGYIASSGPLPPGYHEMLPAQVTDALASTGGPIATPAIIAGALIALFEVGAFLLRRYGRSRLALKAWLAVDSARIPVWLGAVVVGYFGSPKPTLLVGARNLALAPLQAGLVAVGLVALYELFIGVLRRREAKGEDVATEPPTDEV